MLFNERISKETIKDLIKKYKLQILIAVLLVSTAIFTTFVYIPEVKINSNIEVVVDTPQEIVEEITATDPFKEIWELEEGKISTYTFSFLNRELPTNWNERELYLKYQYIGEYNEGTVEYINKLLKEEFSWKNQLDENGNVIFNGPLLLKDGTYQLYVHNTRYLARKYYLLGDVLEYLSKSNTLIGTQIETGNLKLEAKWQVDIHVWENSYIDEQADLIISTCLESNGDRRLVVGWDIVE
jgi:hypothetical protein